MKMLSQALGTIVFGIITMAILAYIWVAGSRAEKRLANKNRKQS
jgi:cbb3-type cytochrome oxidase subunit 3